jgi:DNA-binding SARP family transcriptional activator
VEFRILGPVCVTVDGSDVVLDGAKPRTVLAALLLARGRVLTDTQLGTLLWDWSPPATASAQIYTYVSRLRRRLGPDVDITRRSPGYLIRLGGARFDYEEFEVLSQLGHRDVAIGQYEQAAHHFRMALAQWRGPPLANVTEFLAHAAAPPLDEARMATLEARIEAEFRLGDHLRLAAELTGLVVEYPLRENLSAQLMTALYRCDRQADAIVVYQDARRLLAEELGVDPGPALARTYRALLTGELAFDPPPAGLPPPAMDLWTHVRPAMLPPDIVDFAGRDDEFAEVCDHVRRQRTPTVRRVVVALTGMAGVGKTALAVRVAHSCQEDFPDGQLHAELGGAGGCAKEPFEILGSFLKALGVQEWAIPANLDDRQQLYRSRLADLRMLLLLDNAASDDQVRPLLPNGAGCRTIVTSRTYLATLDGAYSMCLDVPDAAQAHKMLGRILPPDRAACEPAAAQYIVELCGRLPLALRIVAARLVARPQLSLARLAHRLSDERSRLDELQPREGMGVRDAFQPNYQGLDDATRTAFRRLALLGPADFPVSAAAAVFGEPEIITEKALEILVDARLLNVAEDRSGLPHYRLNDLVRCFAGERARQEDDPDCPDPRSPAARRTGRW